MARAPIDRSRLEIRRLTESDAPLLERFACGDEDLDDFLSAEAQRLGERNVVRTFLALYDSALSGYASLMADAVAFSPSTPIPSPSRSTSTSGS